MPPKAAPRTADTGDKDKVAAKSVKPHPSVTQQKQYAQNITELELPKTSLIKLAKGSIPDNVKMQQDVVHALMRSSTLFISYLTAAAHDQALSRSGRSITAGDVIKAIMELDFGPADNLVPILEQELAAYRAQQAANKASKAKGASGRGPPKGKRKAVAVQEDDANDADVSMAVDGEDEGEEDEEQEDDEDGDGGRDNEDVDEEPAEAERGSS